MNTFEAFAAPDAEGERGIEFARLPIARYSCLDATMRLLLLALAVLAAPLADAETLIGRVVGIADGDTITVLDSLNHQHKIRLAGIDAPEKGQPFGNEPSRISPAWSPARTCQSSTSNSTATSGSSARSPSTAWMSSSNNSEPGCLGGTRSTSVNSPRRIGSLTPPSSAKLRKHSAGCGETRIQCRPGSGEGH